MQASSCKPATHGAATPPLPADELDELFACVLKPKRLTLTRKEVIMMIHMFGRSFNPGRKRSGMRSTVVLLTVAAMGYGAGALVHDPLRLTNDPVAFVQPVQAAEANSGDAFPAAATLATVLRADDSRWSAAEWTENPRECDAARGISTACIFMD